LTQKHLFYPPETKFVAIILKIKINLNVFTYTVNIQNDLNT